MNRLPTKAKIQFVININRIHKDLNSTDSIFMRSALRIEIAMNRCSDDKIAVPLRSEIVTNDRNK